MDNLDKTTRSIFVGNIPYEATEEKLMSLFNKAGPVIGFRLVYDRESGKPKGYGFCEYNSPAVAASALRNLDNIDYNGRPLRIGPAAGEQNSAEVAMTNNTTMKPPQESPYGEKVDPQQSGVAISQAVASLPPEQLFDLMQQMKQCIQSNPNESRQLLLQNPQLTYALLQAQIIMKIVEPKVAIAMLTRSNEQIPQAVIDQPQSHQNMNIPPQMFTNQQYPPNVDLSQQHTSNGMPQTQNMFRPGMMPIMNQNMPMPSQMPPPFNVFPGPPMGNNFGIPSMFAHQTVPVEQNIRENKPEAGSARQQEAVASEMINYLGRTGEKDKAALIMQVLSLTDEQVAQLPVDQRSSIEVLKSQLKKN